MLKHQKSSLLGLFVILIVACGGGSDSALVTPTITNKSIAFEFYVTDKCGEEIPLEGVDVVIYEDNNVSIIHELASDINGVASITYESSNSVSFTALYKSPSGSVKAQTLIEAPFRDYKLNMNINSEDKQECACNLMDVNVIDSLSVGNVSSRILDLGQFSERNLSYESGFDYGYSGIEICTTEGFKPDVLIEVTSDFGVIYDFVDDYDFENGVATINSELNDASNIVELINKPIANDGEPYFLGLSLIRGSNAYAVKSSSENVETMGIYNIPADEHYYYMRRSINNLPQTYRIVHRKSVSSNYNNPLQPNFFTVSNFSSSINFFRTGNISWNIQSPQNLPRMSSFIRSVNLNNIDYFDWTINAPSSNEILNFPHFPSEYNYLFDDFTVINDFVSFRSSEGLNNYSEEINFWFPLPENFGHIVGGSKSGNQNFFNQIKQKHEKYVYSFDSVLLGTQKTKYESTELMKQKAPVDHGYFFDSEIR